MRVSVKVVCVALILVLPGCGVGAAFRIDQAISAHDQASKDVKLGDSTQVVSALLEPTQEGMTLSERKPPDRYLKDGVAVEIYYYRSRRQPDGLTTDDEFTPYVFNDGKLVAIGWAAIGGPKSVGQATDDTFIYIPHTTIVH